MYSPTSDQGYSSEFCSKCVDKSGHVKPREIIRVNMIRCRVNELGMSREKAAEITKNGQVGVLGTVGTVVSESYPMELQKWSGGKIVSTVQEACPMWVPIVENNEIGSPGAEYFIEKNISNILQKNNNLDTLILGCTHYPLLLDVIKKYLPERIKILEQGQIVSEKLVEYLRRHPQLENRITRNRKTIFQTTEDPYIFENKATLFMGQSITAKNVHL